MEHIFVGDSCPFCSGYPEPRGDCDCLEWLKKGFDSDPDMKGQAEFFMERATELKRQLIALKSDLT